MDAILPCSLQHRQTDRQAQRYCWQMISCLPKGFKQPVMHDTAQPSPAQPSPAAHMGWTRPDQHSTAQHSTAQHSTAQHSTAQHSTAQHSASQHSTAQLTSVAAAFSLSELCSMLSASIEMHSNLVDLPLVCCDKTYSLLTGHIKDIKMMSESLPTMT